MNDCSPRVSVVMTVYNGATYLREAIDSILNQTLTGFEFLIVDDASTDATQQVLTHYAQHDHRVRLLKNGRNLGLTKSLNVALDIARAPLIARMDADDISEPDRLERQVAFMDGNPDHMLVGGGYISINERGRRLYVKRNPMDCEVAGWTARLRMPMVHPSFCFRTRYPDGSAVRYDVDFPVAQDFALVSKLARSGRIAVLDGILVRYRMHTNNISTQRNADQSSLAMKVVEANLASHYPRHIQTGLQPYVETFFRKRPPSAAALTSSACAMRNLIAYDSARLSNARTWLRRRLAGMLAEAFIAGQAPLRQLLMGLQFVVTAPDFVLPLLFRMLEVRGWIAQRPAPVE